MSHDVKVEQLAAEVPVLDGHELTAAERAEFDFIDWPAVEDGRESVSFFRYNGDLHYLNDFMRVSPRGDSANPYHAFSTGETPDWAQGWDGYRSDSFFSGMLVRYDADSDDETVTIALVTC